MLKIQPNPYNSRTLEGSVRSAVTPELYFKLVKWCETIDYQDRVSPPAEPETEPETGLEEELEVRLLVQLYECERDGYSGPLTTAVLADLIGADEEQIDNPLLTLVEKGFLVFSESGALEAIRQGLADYEAEIPRVLAVRDRAAEAILKTADAELARVPEAGQENALRSVMAEMSTWLEAIKARRQCARVLAVGDRAAEAILKTADAELARVPEAGQQNALLSVMAEMTTWLEAIEAGDAKTKDE
jgi:hypothetical protein